MTLRTLLLALACSIATNVSALPYAPTFTSTTYTTQTVATTSSDADVHDDASPPSGLPLVTSSSVFDLATGDAASAGAINDVGLMTVNTTADSASGPTSAVATAHFTGIFLGQGLMELLLGFNPTSFAFGDSAFAAASLFVTVMSNSTTVFSDVFTVGGPLGLLVDVPFGTMGTLDLLLQSEASALLPATSASNTTTLTISASVPEPSTGMLLALAVVLMLGITRARRLRSGAAA